MSEPTPADAATAPTETPKKSGVKRYILAAVLLIASAVGLRYYIHSLSYEDTDDAYLEGHVVAISSKVAGHVLKVHVADNQEVKAGDLLVEIDPRDFVVRLESARAALKAAKARAGAAEKTVELTKVTSGAGVGEASSGVTRAKAGSATVKTMIEEARAGVQQAEAHRATAKAQEEQARADIAAAEAEAKLAKTDLERYQKLVNNGYVTRQQVDQAATAATATASKLDAVQKRLAATQAMTAEAEAAIPTAKESLRQAESQLTEAEAGVGQAQSRLTGAQSAPQQVAASQAQAQAANADIELAEAAVRQAELALSYTRVTAPVAGRITKKMAEEGAYVQAGQALAAVVPRDFWVVANFKETQMKRIRPGQSVTVVIDAFPDREFTAKVDSIQSGAGTRFSLLPPENASGNYVKVVQRMPVKIVFDQPLPADLPLGPGMSVAPEVRVK